MNALKREVTGLIRQQHRGKSLEELLDIEFGYDYDEEEQRGLENKLCTN